MSHDSAVPAQTKELLGHPRGLMVLFFTELWERFSYYGMRAILILFMTAAADVGGLEWDADKAGGIYGVYTALVYMMALPGGWLADRFLGQHKAVLYGGIIIMIGHICLAMHGLSFFYLGLLAIVIGTGLLKPNISAMVGQLYTPEDVRRDAGFSIFYMGINVGAFLSPLVCGGLAQGEWFAGFMEERGWDVKNSWHWGFGAAAVGMGLGLVQYMMGSKHLAPESHRPSEPESPEAHAKSKRLLTMGIAGTLALILGAWGGHAAGMYTLTPENVATAFGFVLLAIVVVFFLWLFLGGDWTPEEKKNLKVIFVLFCASSVFWSVFEQAGSTLNLFAENSTNNAIGSWSFPASYFQSLNALFIMALAPVFAWLWIALKHRDPSSPAKFTLGLIFVGAGFAVLVGGAALAADGARVSPWWLFSVYLLHTIGELCLSPVGLSAMTKLAPQRLVGLMMGVWFLSTSVGNYLGGTMARFYDDMEQTTMFTMIAAFAIGSGVVLALCIKPIARMLKAKEE